MLVCNYKVRCISFEKLTALNEWIEVLNTNLIYNYFHAELVVASRGSRLAKYTARRTGYKFYAQKNCVQSSCISNPRSRLGPREKSSGDGYLHVTRDRICFTTGLNCARPRLLATWNFDNDEIVQCGTARVGPQCLSLRPTSSVENIESDNTRPALLFFLTAFPDHPEAPGSYLFLSDRAVELCEWIEKNNRTAVDQAEWRRLTSIAAVLDDPNSSKLKDSDGTQSWDTDYSLLTPYKNRSTGFRHLSVNGHDSPECKLYGGQDELSPDQVIRAGSFEEVHLSLQRISEPHTSTTASSVVSCPRTHEEQKIQRSLNSSFLNHEAEAANSICTSHDKQDSHILSPSGEALIEFCARKSAAIHSRRRFSSHPLCVTDESFCSHVSSTGSCGCSAVPEPQLRRSEPQLVTISHLPIPPAVLKNYLDQRSKYQLACFPSSKTPLVPLPTIPAANCHSISHLSREDDSQIAAIVPQVRQRINFSECSAACASDFVNSDQKLSSSIIRTNTVACDSSPKAPVFAHIGHTRRRRRLPSSWSTTTSAAVGITGLPLVDSEQVQTAADTQVAPSTATGLPTRVSEINRRSPSLIRSLSNGNSPHLHVTSLHPTSTVVPGSRYFAPRRRHTASASEVLSVRSGFSSGDSFAVHSGSMFKTTPHTTVSSLISLATSVIPLWAEAPSKAKPRTGCNYVSRDMIASLYSQRQQQLQQHNYYPPTPPPQHPLHSSGTSLDSCPTNHPSVCASHVHQYQCSTVLEMKENDDSASKPPELRDRTDHSFIGSSLKTPNLRPSAGFHSSVVSSLAFKCFNGNSTTNDFIPLDVKNVSQITDRSYINMVPTSTRNNRQQTREFSYGAMQQYQVTECLLDAPGPMNSEKIDGIAVSIPNEITILDPTHTTQCSYVNFTAPDIPLTQTGEPSSTGNLPLQSQYINMVSDALSSCCVNSQSGCCNSPRNTTVACSSCEVHPVCRSSTHETMISSTHRPQLNGIIFPTSHEAARNTDAFNSGSVRTTSHGTTADSGPRLHYAHLTLSSSSSYRTMGSCVTSVSDQIDSHSSSVPTSHSLPCSMNAATMVTTTTFTSPTSIQSTVTCSSTTPPSSLNYVTIDFVQTKALSELERELRGAAELDASSHLMMSSSTPGTSLTHTITLPSTSTALQLVNRNRRSEHTIHESIANCGSNKNSDNISVPFHLRILNRLAHSFTFHHNHRSQSTGRDRNEKLNTGKRLGLFADSSPVTTAVSLHN